MLTFFLIVFRESVFFIDKKGQTAKQIKVHVQTKFQNYEKRHEKKKLKGPAAQDGKRTRTDQSGTQRKK